uniref:Uncharacterized protein n=1 Tax=Anguilla anguilla TaxID=7936 RepID=A0A0E9P637_ANGAN
MHAFNFDFDLLLMCNGDVTGRPTVMSPVRDLLRYLNCIFYLLIEKKSDTVQFK